MPMIDVYAPADLFPAGTDRTLAEELTGALLRAEGVTAPSSLHLDNTAAYVHRLPTTGVHPAQTASARTVRVQVLTPPGALNRAGQKRLVAEVTRSSQRSPAIPRNPRARGCSSPKRRKALGASPGTAFGRAEFAA